MALPSILGFQLRVAPSSLPEWPAERRARYLLVETVGRPLSVDASVWPLAQDQSALEGDGLNGLGLRALKPGGRVASPAGARVVALSAPGEAAYELRRRHKISIPDLDPAGVLQRGFYPEGYDVADAFLTSGLMDCGFEPAEKAELAARFGAGLNASGLFVSPREADEFRKVCDARVKEHAPFVVYGVWAAR